MTTTAASRDRADQTPSAAGHPVRPPDPPGPKGLPYFGSLREIRENPMDFYVRVSQTYGPIARFFYGRNPTYLISSPELIRELLIERKEVYIKNERYEALKRLIGNGLLLSEGEHWQRQRSATGPGFKPQAMADRVPRMAKLIDGCLESWEPWVGSDEAVDIEPEITTISQMLIGDWLLGNHNQVISRRIAEALRRLTSSWPKPPKGLFGHLWPPAPGQMKKLKQALEDLDACFFDAIAAERAQQSESFSLLSVLSRHEDDNGRFTDQQLRDQLITLYMAGFETSASTLVWLFYRLSQQPETRARFYREVADVLGNGDPVPTSPKDLDFVRRSVQETLRIYPPAYNFSRVAQRDDVLGGYHIPKGRMVIVAPWATHRLRSIWENPEGFDPDRFLPEKVKQRNNFAFIPFGAGHRTCIGLGLAMIQTTLVAARLAQRYVLDLEPAHRVEHVPGTVMRPRFGMRMHVRKVDGVG